MTRMPWGKFRGHELASIETSYLVWVLDSASNVRPWLADAIRAELRTRFGAEPPPPPPATAWRKPCPDPQLAASIIASGFKQLARRHHPDVGGDMRIMQQLNRVREWFTGIVQ